MLFNLTSGIEKILCVCFIFVPLTLASTQVSWENCNNDGDSIKLLNLTLTPYPIIIPGPISIEATVHTDQDVTGPIKLDLTLHKKILFSYVSVPCVSGIGSCSYDDLCTLCPQCGCPLKAGDHAVTLSVNIYASSWALIGYYQGKVDIKTSSGQKACARFDNVHIKSSR
ncbi:unnamed protein product [Rotaria magnacalcarata]|uniref:MD-2-related lipid-recognition domain-containing protein n=2 Tax=Rotaria magnacalcarata TaxID=392030 RepID=A0A815X0A9_9BILA|nr:unnamed protein product [Rotaria magnacalcarata]CAF1571019.1 unnamed protein product [Rotaria magnacalcarata]CAF2042053.1 unnamed protein product [Rotaria magnacalcarata]CAF2159924.1 unnamed protein product [Rotaria magnacalcarata]CAF3887088.1 unnamed protein product [Rotaria magnacalcarata]